VALPGREGLDLHVFLDKSVLEVFADGGREVVTRVTEYHGPEVRGELFALRGTPRVFGGKVWNLEPAWRD